MMRQPPPRAVCRALPLIFFSYTRFWVLDEFIFVWLLSFVWFSLDFGGFFFQEAVQLCLPKKEKTHICFREKHIFASIKSTIYASTRSTVLFLEKEKAQLCFYEKHSYTSARSTARKQSLASAEARKKHSLCFPKHK